ncbi:MAG: hypothetical protein BVN35_19885 [Proteobacteria bacterium ST_bin11]|nr:MAG: hypothetical protein BVN35_19885 [Proteobacteria bacterium ST_bin11]
MAKIDSPSNEVFSLLDELCEFPWAIDAFSDLRRYVKIVNDFLPHATAQQKVRLSARIKSETEPVNVGECESELESVQRDESTVLPRLVWGGVLVSCYAAFEFGLESIFRHWQIATKHSIPFKKEPKKDFLSSAERYAKQQIGVPLFASNGLRGKLFELKDLRNSFAHTGGQLSPTLKHKIIKIGRSGLALDIVDDHWIASLQAVEFYLLIAEKVILSFGDAVSEKCLSNNYK